MDFLETMRQSYMKDCEKRSWTQRDNSIEIGGSVFLLSMETNFVSAFGSRFTVRDILHILRTSDENQGDYEKIARSSDHSVIANRAERKMLIDYFIGRIDVLPSKHLLSRKRSLPELKVPRLRAANALESEQKIEFERIYNPMTYWMRRVLETHIPKNCQLDFSSNQFSQDGEYDCLMAQNEDLSEDIVNIAEFVRKRTTKQDNKPLKPYSRYSQEKVDPRTADDPAINEAIRLSRMQESQEFLSHDDYYVSKDTPIPRDLTKIPIIIIPVVKSSILSMFNAKDVLGDCFFVPNEVKLRQGTAITDDVLITRKNPDRREVNYLLTGNLRALKRVDWEFRVVAMFCIDADWQFRDFPWPKVDHEVFKRVKPFYFKFKSDPIPKRIAALKAKIIQVDRDNRIYDKFDINEFWKSIREHIVQTKPYLIK
ncbi:hypothetical protein ACOME3_004755 [Neoechinorhynchus agilis]